MRRLALAPACLALLTLMTAIPAEAGTVDKSAPFAFDTWTDINSTDGPVTLHRIRIEKKTGAFSKSAFIRPGNSEYLETVQIQLEYSNTSKDDWKAHFDLKWVDADGQAIDGYSESENLDDSENHTQDTITLSTLKYGIERAKKLEIKIKYDHD